MKMLALLLFAVASPVAAAGPDKLEQARIPFPDRHGIWSFHAESDEVVYLQDRRRRWYRAELASRCWGLKFANAIGYDTRGSSTFDRFSAIIVEGMRCPLLSLTRSDKPDRKRKRRREA